MLCKLFCSLYLWTNLSESFGNLKKRLSWTSATTITAVNCSTKLACLYFWHLQNKQPNKHNLPCLPLGSSTVLLLQQEPDKFPISTNMLISDVYSALHIFQETGIFTELSLFTDSKTPELYGYKTQWRGHGRNNNPIFCIFPISECIIFPSVHFQSPFRQWICTRMTRSKKEIIKK